MPKYGDRTVHAVVTMIRTLEHAPKHCIIRAGARALEGDGAGCCSPCARQKSASARHPRARAPPLVCHALSHAHIAPLTWAHVQEAAAQAPQHSDGGAGLPQQAGAAKHRPSGR